MCIFGYIDAVSQILLTLRLRHRDSGSKNRETNRHIQQTRLVVYCDPATRRCRSKSRTATTTTVIRIRRLRWICRSPAAVSSESTTSASRCASRNTCHTCCRTRLAERPPVPWWRAACFVICLSVSLDISRSILLYISIDIYVYLHRTFTYISRDIYVYLHLSNFCLILRHCVWFAREIDKRKVNCELINPKVVNDDLKCIYVVRNNSTWIIWRMYVSYNLVRGRFCQFVREHVLLETLLRVKNWEIIVTAKRKWPRDSRN